MERHRKAKADGPFPWDRVFPSNLDIELFGDELVEFCEGMADMTAALEKAQKQIESMQV